jgi:hypothetical protein
MYGSIPWSMLDRPDAPFQFSPQDELATGQLEHRKTWEDEAEALGHRDARRPGANDLQAICPRSGLGSDMISRTRQGVSTEDGLKGGQGPGYFPVLSTSSPCVPPPPLGSADTLTWPNQLGLEPCGFQMCGQAPLQVANGKGSQRSSRHTPCLHYGLSFHRAPATELAQCGLLPLQPLCRHF